MEQQGAASPQAQAAEGPPSNIPAGADPDAGDQDGRPGFGKRGRLRRRLRFLRRARELAYRDLGGLIFNLHRFGQRNDALVLAKLNALTRLDSELRALESSLQEAQPVTVLREAGVSACPRCAAIHSSEDRFCPACGLPMSRHVDLPIAGPATAAPSPSVPGPASAAPSPPAGGGAPGSPPAQAPAGAAASGPPPVQAPAGAGASPPSAPPADPAPAGAPGASTGALETADVAPASERSSPDTEHEQDQPTEIMHPRGGGA